MSLDLRTVSILVALGFWLQGAVLTFEGFRKDYPGVGAWAVADVLIGCGFVVFSFHGLFPVVVIGAVGDSFTVSASMALHVGTARFVGRRPWWRAVAAVGAVYAASTVVFLVRDSYGPRVALNTALAGFLTLLVVRDLLSRDGRPLPIARLFTGLVFSAWLAILAIRAGRYLVVPPSPSMFAPELPRLGFFLGAFAASLLLTAGFTAMIAGRLHDDLRESQERLEDLVRARTLALERANAALGREVAERARTEQEVRTLNQELQEEVARARAATRELEAFSYSVSHDLRAPVRAIDGFAGLLGERLGDELDAESRRLLEVVRTSAHRMGRLIDDLLAFVQAGRTELRREEVDMTALARTAVAEALPPAAREAVDVTVEELPGAVGDRALLAVVFRHLVTNAVKFSAHRLRPVIVVGSRAAAGGTEYFVRDDGAGFDPLYAHHLFEVFSRLRGPDETDATGIGLAMVRRIVERHGGRVRAEGEVDRGSTFSFTLGRPR